MENEALRAMRSMAWERAKGELKSMLWTFYPEYSPKNGAVIPSSFDDLEKKIDRFIKAIEDNGLQE